MSKKHHDQGIFDDEKYIREHAHLTRPPRLSPEVKRAKEKNVRKEKGTNAKPKDKRVPLM